MILIFVGLDLVVRDLDFFQPQPLGQVRRNEASDLQSLKIIQGRGERTKIQEWEQKRGNKKPRHHSLNGGATHHVAIVTESTILSRLNAAGAAAVAIAYGRFQSDLPTQSKVSSLQLPPAQRNYPTASGHDCVSIANWMNVRAQEIASGLPSDLDSLPRLGGFRLRGIGMTRLETFHRRSVCLCDHNARDRSAADTRRHRNSPRRF